jgi:hypothetical protein
MCYTVCEEIRMFTCSDRTCADQKFNCKRGFRIIDKTVLKAFVEFLGHIYFIKSEKKFGWSHPEGLKKAKLIMDSKYYANISETYRIVNQIIKLALKKKSKLEKVYSRDVEKTGSSFFKSKDNKPLKLIFEWTDFSKLHEKYLKTILSRSIKRKFSFTWGEKIGTYLKLVIFVICVFENLKNSL